jgi:hypothetical protein
MPYFVFRISADNQFTLVNTFEKFPEAKQLCRDMRAKAAPGSSEQIRMAFAKSEYEAKRLLAERRNPASPLEEWEA